MKIPCYIYFLILFVSCTYPCGKSDGLKISFISYSEQEISSYLVIKYIKGSNFSILVDSLKVDSTIGRYYRTNDTLNLGSFLSTARLSVDYDYKIQIPSVNKTYEITELLEPQLEGRKSMNKDFCMNAIQSCMLNAVRNKINHNTLYLRK